MRIEDNYSHHAFNKSVVIEIPDYQYNHHPLDGSENERYIGRERIEMQFLQYLESGSPRGSYLVTGYRGMGKTSFVNKVIKKYKDQIKGKTVEKIDLSFSQKNLNKEDILKQILESLIIYLESKDSRIIRKIVLSNSRLVRFFVWALSGVLLVVIYPVLFEIMKRWTDPFFFSLRPFGNSPLFSALAWLTLGVSLFTLFILFSIRLHTLFKSSYFQKIISRSVEPEAEDIYLRLLELKLRSNAILTEEENINSTTLFPNFPFSLFSRKSRNYPMMRGKDIENDLIKIIDKFEKTDLIFVFDELDKVDVGIDWNEPLQETKDTAQSYNRSREQKETIVSILASLKFFMSQTKAKFIFIAGREMFDAALADIADRQNYLGSIFHHVIYVDSFLKDSPVMQNTGLTQRVEEYLERILLGSYPPNFIRNYNTRPDEDIFLRKYFFFLKDHYLERGLTMEEILKIIFSLQMFIIYIIYRCNGSPKKMTKIIEEHIFKRDQEEHTQFKSLTVRCVDLNEFMVSRKGENQTLYLTLTYDIQYRNAYISYLFRPFLMNYSTYAKRLSDKILVAIPFMIDHILKFHAFAFSRQNLELLPEVISPNRTHLVRNLIFDLISYFSENHIKNIEMGLFEYRFNRKTSDELKFISKIFEEESAAFNFSLDEMESVKAYLQSRIGQLRATHAGSMRDTTRDRTVYSLSFLESLMGDAYYFDKEYDLAILSYLDSIQSLRYEENSRETFENRISVLRLLLKIGLMYELMKKFDMALGYFYDALQYYKDNFSEEGKRYNYVKDTVRMVPMQLFFKTLLSVISLTEKKINNGLTLGNLEEFRNLVNTYSRSGGYSYVFAQHDDNNPRINLELSHYYTELGTLLFHKNIIPIKSRNQIPAGPDEPEVIRSEELIFRITFTNLPVDDMLEFRILYPHKDYRPTLAALGEYKRALLSMLSSSEEKEIRAKDGYFAQNTFRSNDLEYVKFSTLMFFAAKKVKDYKNVYVASYLQICANTLSNIGDSLFSLTVRNINKLEFIAAYAKHYKLREYIATRLTDSSRKNTVRTLVRRLKYSRDKSYAFSSFIKKDREEILTLLEAQQTEELKKKCEPRPMKFWDDITYDYFEYLAGLHLSSGNIYFKSSFSESQFIVFVYYLSARYFSKGGLNHNFSHLIKKIFQIVRNNSDRRDLNPTALKNMQTVISFFENTLLKLLLESASRSSYSTDRPQMQKYKHYEGLNWLKDSPGNFARHPEAFRRYNYFNLSNGPEVKEAVLYFALLKLKISRYPEIPIKPLNPRVLRTPRKASAAIRRDHNIIYSYLNHSIPELKLINPNNVPSSQYSRILEVDLHARINRIILKKIADKYQSISTWEHDLYFKLKRNPDEVNIKDVVAQSRIHRGIFNFLCELVSSSVFLHVQQIKVYNIFQVNPALNHTNLALYHIRLGRWLKYYLILNCIDKEFYPENKVSFIDSRINALFGNNYSQISLDTTSQFQIGLQFLHKAKQYHSNGLAFKRDLENRVYLEGDYSDITYNFGLAVERHKVNSGKVRDEIRKLEKEVANSPLLMYDSFTYLGTYAETDEYINYAEPLKTGPIGNRHNRKPRKKGLRVAKLIKIRRLRK